MNESGDTPSIKRTGTPIAVETSMSKTTYLKLQLLSTFGNRGFYLCITLLIIATYLSIELDTYALLFIFIWSLFGFYVVVLIISMFALVFSSMNWWYYVPMHYTFDEEKVVVRTPFAEGTEKWDVFGKWKAVGGYYTIYNSLTTFIVIPRSALLTEDIPAFESLLRTKVKKRGAAVPRW